LTGDGNIPKPNETIQLNEEDLVSFNTSWNPSSARGVSLLLIRSMSRAKTQFLVAANSTWIPSLTLAFQVIGTGSKDGYDLAFGWVSDGTLLCSKLYIHQRVNL
jgi:hypothetical protein